MSCVRTSDKPSGCESDAAINPSGTLVYSASNPYPGLSPDASRDLDDVIFSLSGDAGLTETRLDELTIRVTRWAAAAAQLPVTPLPAASVHHQALAPGQAVTK